MKLIIQHFVKSYTQFTEIEEDRVLHDNLTKTQVKEYTNLLEHMGARFHMFRGNMEYTLYTSSREYTMYIFYEKFHY